MEEKDKQELVAKAEMFAKTGDVNKSLSLPLNDEALQRKFEEEKLPDAKEERKIKKTIRKIWGNYRKNALESIDLENYKKYCELQEMKAETDKKLSKLKREREKEEAEHWLMMHNGHLKELGFNSESKPNIFWYGLNRGVWYLKKTFENIPKIVWKLLVSGVGIAVIITLVLVIQNLV